MRIVLCTHLHILHSIEKGGLLQDKMRCLRYSHCRFIKHIGQGCKEIMGRSPINKDALDENYFGPSFIKKVSRSRGVSGKRLINARPRSVRSATYLNSAAA